MLKNQKIDDELLSMLSSEDLLTFMVFENCSFESLEDKPIELPKKLSQLSFRGAAPEASFFRSIKRPFMLSMQDLQLSEDVAKELYARSVQSIFFNNVAFDEKTIQRLLRARSLTQITFTLCQFKLDWFADVRRNRPELGINAAPVAFLGVQGPIDISNRNFGGCQISQVVADTGAAKGGLQVNDIIVEVENQRISAFADLRLMISQKKPGEKMKLKVLRGTERLDLTIELGEPNR
jgi:predicted metalloprotease with PDZ domain